MSSVFVARLITAEGDALTCHVYLSGATVILGGARILCIVRLTVKHGLTDVRFDRISSIELRQEAANRNCHLRLQGSYVAKNAIPSLHTWVYKDVNSSLAKESVQLIHFYFVSPEVQIMRLNLSFIFMLTAFGCFATTASAQVGQLNGGATGGATGGGATGGGATGGGTTGGGATPGGTTQGLGGLTTQGPPGAATVNNAATGFVGGVDPNNAFVGAAQQTQRNNSRQFQSITQNGVPTGGAQTNSGTPRQIPVSLKVGFAVPTANAATQLIPRTGTAFRQVAVSKPELRGVQVNVANGVAVLIGQVPTASSRRLAANLVRLRPGVKRVDNRILIGQLSLTPRPVLPTREYRWRE